jgi:tetratricopeptide (TPR) repeat protein
MNQARTFFLLLVALLVLCFGLAADLAPQFQALENSSHQSDNFFSLLLGDSSRIFANSAFVEADAYYHSGYYPTIFDNNSAFLTPHMAADTGAIASHNQGEEDESFLGPPRDWIDAFGRHFIPNRHTHLDEGGPTDDLSTSKEVREILPWLKLSAELDPENIKTYLVTAFWLRTKLYQVNEAEQVLRQGLRHNPDDPQLLFELGSIYFENYHNPDRARNIWETALRSWARQAPGVPQSERLKMTNANFDNRFIFEKLQTNLAQLEEAAGNTNAAIARWEQARLASPKPDDIQKHIDELKQKLAAQPASTNGPAH